ncbi:DUF421 domain-containing protein [Aurantiacibacter spongiae]|uniref:DUF421 domain-containing protein n=1 Tax=Aurantiacibacter spongiae TaxID=2488860 RepID=A0A3N5DCJ6_9SPHN|nr:YetF domain-containing protein [Aurantiacibacter spongiae]RPF72538.1 DUF421 domain-containing protein [Aurantiacibacter spongiae]
MWFDDWNDIVRVAASTGAIYVTLVLILRVVGKRSLSKLNIFDLVVTVALGSTLASIMLNKDISVTEGAVAFIALCGLQWLVAWASLRVTWFKRLIRSDPRMLLHDGKFLDRAMRDERIMRIEVMSVIRKQGYADLEDIAAVVLETDGDFSVIPRSNASTRSALETIPGEDYTPDSEARPAR